MSKKILFYSIGISLLIIVGLFTLFQTSKHVDAQVTSSPLTGYAWSSNIGWIHFNPTYGGVSMAANGNLSGYAWANPGSASNPNLGWLSFNELSGCPSGSCQPKVNLSTGQVTGWAKFINADQHGWDGWVRLSGPNYPSPQSDGRGGVTLGTADQYGIRNFNGFAWGSVVTGWISFHGDYYGVSVGGLGVTCGPNDVNFTPPATVTWSANPTGGNGIYTYSWSGDDNLTGNTQSVIHTYTTAGTYNATVFVSNSSSQGGFCSSSVSIETPPTLESPTFTFHQPSTGCVPQIILQWTAPPGATGYYLYKRAGTTGPFTHGDILSTNSATETVIAGVNYYYYVTALYGLQESTPPSETVGPLRYTTPLSCQSIPPNTVELTAVPAIVPDGGRCNLNYIVGGNADCTITDAGDPAFPYTFSTPGPLGLTGSVQTSPIHSKQTYILDCENSAHVHRTAEATCDKSPTIIEF